MSTVVSRAELNGGAASILAELDAARADGASSVSSGTLQGTEQAELKQPWSPELVTRLSGSFLLFGGAICAVTAALLWRRCRAADILRAFSLPLIIVSAVYLVVTGYSDQQISSVIGLLGAIAGYILGSRDQPASPAVKTPGAGRSAKEEVPSIPA
jgi:hypothetical protein